MRVALATVATDNFTPGALVMIDSFLRHNSWFDGDIMIINRGLGDTCKDQLSCVAPEVHFHTISDELAVRMDAVEQAAGWNPGKAMQFASLEAFSLSQYDHVLFCDADLLFLGSLESLMDSGPPLCACGDGAFFRGSKRRKSDFAEIGPDEMHGQGPCIGTTFNTGMMVLGQGVCSDKNYGELIEMIIPERWSHDTTGHTDQRLINIHFAGQQKIVSSEFNYMLSHQKLIEEACGISPEDAAVLHFTGPAKPWLPITDLTALGINRHFFDAYRKWRSAYSRCMAEYPT